MKAINNAGCSPNPCLNGGTCCSNNGVVSCTCHSSYTGQFCQTGCFASFFVYSRSNFNNLRKTQFHRKTYSSEILNYSNDVIPKYSFRIWLRSTPSIELIRGFNQPIDWFDNHLVQTNSFMFLNMQRLTFALCNVRTVVNATSTRQDNRFAIVRRTTPEAYAKSVRINQIGNSKSSS